MNKPIPILFDEKKDCCACGACLNICPKQAITMVQDEYGFMYPQIDETKCIRCGLCKTVCSFQNKKETNVPVDAYAAISKDQNILQTSSSGGIFAEIAKYVLSMNGIVFGAALQEDFSVRHIKVDSLENLKLLQGSKYTQSNTFQTFKECLAALKENKLVLFSGTPCQIAGLKGFLRKDYDNLITVDIVCHGVPNNGMLQQYLHLQEEKYNCKISDFKFRDKNNGWGINGSALMNGKKKTIWQSSSSYLYYFTKGEIYRDSCYSCKYTCKNRPGDITLGDFWGIEKQHSDWIKRKDIDSKKGISAVISNSEKGSKILKKINVVKIPSSFEKISVGNTQLRTPSKCTKRDELFELYKENGWSAVEDRYKKNIGIRYYSSQIKSLLPDNLKMALKKYKK